MLENAQIFWASIISRFYYINFTGLRTWWNCGFCVQPVSYIMRQVV